MKTRRVLSLLAVLLAGAAAAVRADTLLTWRRDADDFSFGTQRSGGKDQRVLVWIGADRVRQDYGTSAVILRLDQKKLYRLDDESKTYTVVELDLGAGDSPPRPRPVGRFASPEERALEQTRRDLTETLRMRANIQPTSEVRKLGPWQAHRFTVDVSSAVSSRRSRLEWWTSPDLKLDDGLLRKFQLLLASLDPERTGWMEELLARAGEPVLVENVQILPDGTEYKVRDELRSVEEKPAPDGTYEPPAGYRLVKAWEARPPS